LSIALCGRLVDGKRVPIAPGMAVNAEIITGDRRVIDFVLSPILRYRNESGRERDDDHTSPIDEMPSRPYGT
jgi:hypothetical protein